MFDWIKNKVNQAIDARIEAASASVPAKQKKEIIDVPAKTLSSEQINELLKLSFQREEIFRVNDAPGTAMDEAVIKPHERFGLQGVGQDIIYTFFAKHGFIGWQLCALLSQHWLIDKVCTMPNEDAVRPGWENTYDKDDTANDPDILTELKQLSESKYHLSEKLVQFGRNRKIFGIGIAYPVIKGINTAEPFNPDAVKPGSYAGISVIDPYWAIPQWTTDTVSDPGNPHFYEPTYYQLPNGVKIHRSHLIISLNGEVPDILKPSYYFGGIPLPQKIYERVYAAEKTANEAPLLALTKRLLVADGNLENYILEPEEATARIRRLTELRDNFGVFFKNPGDQITQIDTSLTDFDQLIMTQYQLVSSIGEVPKYKLFGTDLKGFNANGEGETKNYIQTLQSLQANILTPLIDRHNLISMRADFSDTREIRCKFNPIDMPTEKELAEVEAMKAQADVAYVTAGVLSAEEVRSKLAADPSNGYNSLSEELPADLTEEEIAYHDEPEEPEVEVNVGDEEPVTGDAEWDESKHARKDNGQFGKGSANSNKETEKSSGGKSLGSLLGTEYTGYKGQAAIEKLLKEQKGHIKSAFEREDIGDIDLVWGDEKIGLQHIIKQREKQGMDLKEFLSDLTDVIEKGSISPGKRGRLEIKSRGKTAVILPEYDGQKVKLVLTAFQNNANKKEPNKQE